MSHPIQHRKVSVGEYDSHMVKSTENDANKVGRAGTSDSTQQFVERKLVGL